MIATESGHWYALDGSPRYTIIGKNGKERGTTIRDAREHNLLPSVTTITKCAAAPGLVNWMVDQAILSALTLPRMAGESEADWLVRVKRDSKETARKAADKGSQIHGAIEKHFMGVPPDEEMFPHVMAVQKALRETFGELDWSAERSFAHPIGFGGKCDLHSKGSRIVVDFKGKDFTDPADCKQYDEHLMQGAAYLQGFDLMPGRFANVFISRNQPGLVAVVEASAEDIQRGWRMFRALLNYWQEQNRYAPMQKAA